MYSYRSGWKRDCFSVWRLGCRTGNTGNFHGYYYVTGLLVAGVFHNSGKTENGALESRAGWKGLCRKCITLLMVLVATRLDLVTGTNFIRDAVVIAFIANETISIVENAGLMGINIPPAITSAIEVLKKKSDSVDNTDQ